MELTHINYNTLLSLSLSLPAPLKLKVKHGILMD